jgi:hypothetical protein
MRRREFMAGLGGAAAAPVLWPVAARAQQDGRIRRGGVLMNGAATDASRQAYVKAFTDALGKAGWIEGKNAIDIRYSAGDVALARIFAAQLIGLLGAVAIGLSAISMVETAGREGGDGRAANPAGYRARHRRHPTPDCLRQSDPPPLRGG